MDVSLYVYDLSKVCLLPKSLEISTDIYPKGLAKQLSPSLLGIQIDAVFHTSLVFGGIEYFFGAGVQTAYPGGTHHGKPMEVVNMGQTHLPLEVILEYLDSLKEIYTQEVRQPVKRHCSCFG